MAQVAVLGKIEDEGPPEQPTDIIVAVAADHSVVLFDETKFEAWLRAKREAVPSGLDMDKAKDRAALKSYAYELRTDRADIKRDRLRLTEESRTRIAKINEVGKRIDTEIGEAIDDILEPVLAWEEIEKKRIAECESIIAGFREAARERLDDTSDAARQRGKDVWGTAIDLERFGSLLGAAQSAKDDAVAALKVTLARLTKEEADRAELDKLRAEKEERDAQEAAEREKAEALKRKSDYAGVIINHIRECMEGRIDGKSYPWMICLNDVENRIEMGARAVEAFGDRAMDVAEERERGIAHIRQRMSDDAERSRREAAEQAANEAREEEATKAQAERDRIQREHDAELQAEREAREQVQRDLAAAEELRIAEERRAERDRQQAEEARQRAAEQTRRDERNKALQRRLKTEAKDAIMSCGVSEDAAQKIVLAIRAGEIPHVRWSASVEQEG